MRARWGRLWAWSRSQHSSGGKTVLGGISKRGDRYLRTLLVHGARAALRTAAQHDDRLSRWATALKQKRGANTAAAALANKHARIIWTLLCTGAAFAPHPPTTAAERAPAAHAGASEKSAGPRLALRLEHGRKSQDFFTVLQAPVRGRRKKSS